MLEYLVVGLIVAAATFYVLRKYLPKSLRARLFGKAAVKNDGCGSGCGSCGTGCDSPAAPGDPARESVIKIHPR